MQRYSRSLDAATEQFWCLAVAMVMHCKAEAIVTMLSSSINPLPTENNS